MEYYKKLCLEKDEEIMRLKLILAEKIEQLFAADSANSCSRASGSQDTKNDLNTSL